MENILIDDPVIAAYEKWLATINADDHGVQLPDRRISAAMVLMEMKNGTEFGLNFKRSIYDTVFQILVVSEKKNHA